MGTSNEILEELLATWLSWLEQTAHTRQVSGSSPLVAISKATFSVAFFFALHFSTLLYGLRRNVMKIIRGFSFAAFLFCALVWLFPSVAAAQSLGIGFGLGVPLMDYFTNEVDREYRVYPEPGYYPVLKTLENAPGSLHLHADVLLPMDDLGIVDEIDIRFDIARLRWKKSRITHTTCSPVDVYNGTFNDASAKYFPLNTALKDEACFSSNTTSYNATEDISGDERASLWFFLITAGARYNFFETEDWKIFVALHLGLAITTTIQSETWFGADIDTMLGFAYRLSPLVWVEFNAKILFLLTEVPDDTQTRINHETQTGGNIVTSLIQPDACVDFQIGIRFDFNAME